MAPVGSADLPARLRQVVSADRAAVRRSQVPNRRGFTIVPTMIEDALRAHPGARDASAVGIPDSRLGEVPSAAITLTTSDPPSEAELPRTSSPKAGRPDVQALFAPGDRAGRASA